MAAEDWHLLKVRSGFETVVAHRLQSRGLEVFIPERKPTHPKGASPEWNPADGYVICGPFMENPQSITNIPGVLCILGSPIPTPVEGDFSAGQAAVLAGKSGE